MGVKGTNCGGINLKHPMILMPTYSARFRAGEAVTVRADVERGTIRIRCGKGRKGRYTISSEAAPGQRKDKHISTRTVQSIFERARNSFATHPLGSGGVDLRHTEELPGHKDSKTTEIDIAIRLERLGFQTYLYDTNYNHGYITWSSFKSIILFVYISTHGMSALEKYQIAFSDEWIFEGILRKKLDDIGVSLDFLWLDTCQSWHFRDELDNLGAGNIVFYGCESDATATTVDAVAFYESILSGYSVNDDHTIRSIHDATYDDGGLFGFEVNNWKMKDRYSSSLNLLNQYLRGDGI